MSLPMALILAGGLGTRLRAVVADRPKPMAEAEGRPFLEYQVEQLRAAGVERVVLCVGHMAERVRAHFGDGGRWGVRIDYAVEAELLGTAGAIGNARGLVDGTFLVLNGDSYLDADIPALVATHRAHREADPRTVGTLAAVWVEDARAFGTLALEEGRRVVGFREKAAEGGAGWINAGLYVLEPEVLEAIPVGRAVSVERETFPGLIAAGRHLYAAPVEGYFIDIGTPEGYRRFQQRLRERGR